MENISHDFSVVLPCSVNSEREHETVQTNRANEIRIQIIHNPHIRFSCMLDQLERKLSFDKLHNAHEIARARFDFCFLNLGHMLRYVLLEFIRHNGRMDIFEYIVRNPFELNVND